MCVAECVLLHQVAPLLAAGLKLPAPLAAQRLVEHEISAEEDYRKAFEAAKARGARRQQVPHQSNEAKQVAYSIMFCWSSHSSAHSILLLLAVLDGCDMAVCVCLLSLAMRVWLPVSVSLDLSF